VGGGRFGDALGRDVAAVLVDRLEMFAIDAHVLRLFAREHGIGLRPGRNQDGPRWQDNLARRSRRIRLGEAQRAGTAELIEQHFLRRQPLGKGDPFLQRFRDLLVIERVAR
jgi:hypothetical protein